MNSVMQQLRRRLPTVAMTVASLLLLKTPAAKAEDAPAGSTPPPSQGRNVQAQATPEPNAVLANGTSVYVIPNNGDNKFPAGTYGIIPGSVNGNTFEVFHPPGVKGAILAIPGLPGDPMVGVHVIGVTEPNKGSTIVDVSSSPPSTFFRIMLVSNGGAIEGADYKLEMNVNGTLKAVATDPNLKVTTFSFYSVPTIEDLAAGTNRTYFNVASDSKPVGVGGPYRYFKGTDAHFKVNLVEP